MSLSFGNNALYERGFFILLKERECGGTLKKSISSLHKIFIRFDCYHTIIKMAMMLERNRDGDGRTFNAYWITVIYT
jgi:hypothetical protein